MTKTNVVFLMAGEGSRFGYKFKPFMKLGDQTFIEHAVEPFYKWKDNIDNVYFIFRILRIR
jgi:molybdopterin-guanine dinucleotide biosynthesis protein A